MLWRSVSADARTWDLKDEEWAVVEPVLRPARRGDHRGRPWHETRAVLHGVALGPRCRRALARTSRAIPAVPNLPSALSAVDLFGQVGSGTEAAGPALARVRKAQPRRGVRRCNLREREKRGLAVGPTRQGKGTKIVAVASGDGFPVAVSVQSVSHDRVPPCGRGSCRKLPRRAARASDRRQGL